MSYTSIVKKFLNYLLLPSILIRLNLWSYLNINFFSSKTSTFLYYFLTNLDSFKIKILYFNKYNNIYFLIILFFLGFFIVLSLLFFLI